MLTATTTWRTPSIDTITLWRCVCAQNALARVDQQHGEIGGRGAGRHVAGVLLVAGRVGDDELALVGREIAIGDVDGDALLALGGEAVDEQREIEFLALRAVLLRVLFERFEQIVLREAGVVKHPADQRRFAVVDRTAGDESQQRLFGRGDDGASSPALARVRRAFKNILLVSFVPSRSRRRGRSSAPAARTSGSRASPR